MKKKIKKKPFEEIQFEVIRKYRVNVFHNECPYGCRTRTHAHEKERAVCKWKFGGGLANTFDLFHEIGHIEANKFSSGTRASKEYHATVWAIERMKEYGLHLNAKTLFTYQRYILTEIYRGIRRRGKDNYGAYNLYKYLGINKTLEDVYDECTLEWKMYMDGYKEHVPVADTV